MFTDWFNMALVSIIALLPIANPISTAALFMTITAGDAKEYKRQQALKGVIYTFAILVVFLIAGSLIMEFFGISIPGLRIAGGVMVIRVAISMLDPKDEPMNDKSRKEAAAKKDISFTPLAMPSLSGPGAIAVTIGLSAGVKQWTDYTAIILGIFALAVLAYSALIAADKIVKFLGRNGMNALSKIMGFLLLCVGIQFLIDAIINIISDEEFINLLLNSYNSITSL